VEARLAHKALRGLLGLLDPKALWVYQASQDCLVLLVLKALQALVVAPQARRDRRVLLDLRVPLALPDRKVLPVPAAAEVVVAAC
jgi:hypothetical protein